jgi:DNA polymerase III epsilon subunit-like protein
MVKKHKFKVNFGNPVVVFDTETGGLNPEHIIDWDITLEKKLYPGMELSGSVREIATPILEIGACKLDFISLEELDFFHSLCGPEEGESIDDLLNKCTEEALQVNGLNRKLDELAKAPPLSKVLRDFQKWATKESKQFIPAGQNINFDIRMMNAAFRRAGVDYEILYHQPLELLALSKIYYSLPDTPIVANYKLTTVAESLGIPTDHAHEALADVRMTCEALRIMLSRLAAE